MKNNYAILGLSLAGAAAAMKLSATGADVRVFELLDDVPLRAWNRVGIGSRSAPGSVLESELLSNLKTAGVKVENGEYQIERPLGNFAMPTHMKLKRFGGEKVELSATAIVIAPNGVVAGMVLPEGWMNLIGNGISESVWSDISFYRNKTVCIAGCSAWTVDQALFAGSFDANTTVLCDCNMAVDVPSTLQFLENTRITGWRVANHQLRGVRIQTNGADQVRDCEAVFLAPNLVPPKFVQKLAQTSNLRFAGVALGIDPGNHEGLCQSGASVAAKILSD
jgi:thioredoxin reductase